MKCGGVGDDQVADEEVKALCVSVKEDLLVKAGKDSFEVFEALSYKSQVVAGTNFFVKIKVCPDGQCVHARIFRPLPHTGAPAELHSVLTDKQVEDAIEYF